VLNSYISLNLDEYGILFFVDPFICVVISCAPTFNCPPNFMSIILSSTSIPISFLSNYDMSMVYGFKDVMAYGFEDICLIYGSEHVKDITTCDHVMVFVAFYYGDGTNLD
jgi:hypothetical protein